MPPFTGATGASIFDIPLLDVDAATTHTPYDIRDIYVDAPLLIHARFRFAYFTLIRCFCLLQFTMLKAPSPLRYASHYLLRLELKPPLMLSTVFRASPFRAERCHITLY